MGSKIFFQILFFICLAGILQSCRAKRNSLELIRSEEKITKVQMKISSSAGLKYFEMTNSTQLDSLTQALKEATEIKTHLGGAFEMWADATVYKGKTKTMLHVLFSKYNGWYIDIYNETLRCDYLFDLVKKYSGK